MLDSALIFRQLIDGRYNAISLGDPMSRIYENYGRPVHQEGEKGYGFIYYGLLRFGFMQNRVDEIGFDFNRGYGDAFRIAVGERELVFENGTSVVTCFYLLNELQIPWIACGNEVFAIQTFLPKSKVLITAYDYSGELSTIKIKHTKPDFTTGDFLTAFRLDS